MRAHEISLSYDLGPRFSLRTEPCSTDIHKVEALVRATGFFNDEEVAIAAELVSERLANGTVSGYEFLFAERKDKLAGYVCFGRIPCTLASYELYWLVVAPALQGRGIGKALLFSAEAAIAAQGGKRVYIDTSGQVKYQPTRAFYQGAGYREIAVLEDHYGPGDPKVIYQKVLGESGPYRG